MAKVILAILKKYSILNKLGVWVADNADSNDTTIKVMMKEIDPSVKDISPYRSRCLRYIINLAAKAFLFSNDVEAFEAIAELVDDSTLMDSLVM